MIILGGTPIGNLGDASARLREVLESSTVVACEDTRTTAKLLAMLGVTNRPKLVALHEHNETARVAELVTLAADTDLLVLSDAGMPTVSDPGFVLVRAAVEAGVRVTVIPGPSAVITALAVSGLPTDRFTFEGFLPRKASERRTTFAALSQEPRTMVFFESPHRIAQSLADARDAFGSERPVAVCRELTKMFEEVKRGALGEVAEWARDEVRGEIVVVIGGAPVGASVNVADALAEVTRLTLDGVGLNEACAQVAQLTGLRKRDLYQGALAARPKI